MEKTIIRDLTGSTANKRLQNYKVPRSKFVEKLSKLDMLRFDGLEASVKDIKRGTYRDYMLKCQEYLAFIKEKLEKNFG